MKKCLIFSLIFFAKVALSQVNDNFSDGDFKSNPQWSGSNSENDFTVVNNQLRSNSTNANSSFYLSTPNTLASACVWEFYCNLQFATSGSNYVDVYLIADQGNLQSASINGYFVRIGNTSDEISLYKRSGAASTNVKLIDGTDGIVASTSNNRIRVRVSRTASNMFTLERDVTGTSSTFVSEGTATDASFTSSKYFGLLVQQSTSGFFQKHFFDDFKVEPLLTDTAPPKLLSALVTGENTIEMLFDEPLLEATANLASSYHLDKGYGHPASVTIIGAERYLLTYATPFKTDNYTITATNLSDKNGNVIAGNNRIQFTYVQPYQAQKGDLVINELLADPSPQVDLPALEFVELWNHSVQVISLKNWKFSDATTAATLPDYRVQPDEYLILCAKADTAEFKKFGKVLGISPWPSLNNASDVLKIVSSAGRTIDSLAYRDSWYQHPEKKAGGWSLEQIDPEGICKGIQNWSASTDATGGTPGKRNSIYKKASSTDPLTLVEVAMKDSTTLTVLFNRTVDSLLSTRIENFQVNNGLGSPVALRMIAPEFVKAELSFSQIARGKTYLLTTRNISDCAGIQIQPGENALEFFIPNKIQKNDLQISEILFNPRAEGVDFLEIYNNSEGALDLKELSIATIRKDTLNSIRPVSSSTLLLEPGSYIVLTTDPEKIRTEYPGAKADALLKMSSMPAFNDDAGTAILLSGKTVVDQLSYHDKMHFPLIKEPEGVSLERVSFRIAANEPGNFRSAAASVGFATPGYKNSQAVPATAADAEVSLQSETFSPDNDGFEDALLINYKFPESGKVANASIFNDRGVLVKRLAKNSTLALEGSLIWDGINESNSRAELGIYTLYLEVFDLNGFSKKYRKSFVLAGKMQ
ncbi:lamin tail domain-containing protein [Pedobacter sp. SYSU D00535]|uniref:lamin tail domain-containing protein n=1 Tax=Pedobacter sp. SYSU D00535 TaxID=2810308 RepID=UPI001A975384|nr:lamin tail domain-containing protein [Pedobacter sp. SYSU D00535]